MKRAVLAFVTGVLALSAPVAPAVAGGSDHGRVPKQGDTVVSFTFDDIWGDQKSALDILEEHKMAATLYTISSRVGAPGSLSYTDLKDYTKHGYEIGGHTIDHVDLTKVTAQEARRQICDDRVALVNMGFNPKNFAYPYGAENHAVEKIVKDCGYNSARTLPGIRSPGYGKEGCLEGCPAAESIPPSNRWAIRTPTTVRNSTTLSMMKQYVTQAEESGGGWVPLVFHHICHGKGCPENSMSIIDFANFVEWLTTRPKTTYVETVGQVITPPPPKDPYGSLSKAPAVVIFGYGIGQTQIMATGILMGLTALVTWRLASRKSRYVQTVK